MHAVEIRRIIPALLLAACLHAGLVQAGAYDDILAAAEHGHNEVVLGLLRLGMDVNTAASDGTTLLMFAARNGNSSLLEILLRNRANYIIKNKYGDTAIKLAALQGRLEIVKRLAGLGDTGDGEGTWSALQYAALAGHVEVARVLLSKGAHINAYAPNRQTPLMLAAVRGQLEMVKFLCDAHADLDLKDEQGRTALDLAREKGNVAVIGYLADIENCD